MAPRMSYAVAVIQARNTFVGRVAVFLPTAAVTRVGLKSKINNVIKGKLITFNVIGWPKKAILQRWIGAFLD